MRAFGVVILALGRERCAGVIQGREQRLVQKLVAQATVEALDEGILCRLAGRDAEPLRRHWFGPNGEGQSILRSSAKVRIAFEVNSVPLLKKTIPRIVF